MEIFWGGGWGFSGLVRLGCDVGRFQKLARPLCIRLRPKIFPVKRAVLGGVVRFWKWSAELGNFEQSSAVARRLLVGSPFFV